MSRIKELAATIIGAILILAAPYLVGAYLGLLAAGFCSTAGCR